MQKDDFELFRDQVASLFVVYRTFDFLYRDTDRLGVLAKADPRFFTLVGHLLFDEFYLAAARLTDPAVSKVRGKDRYNLSARSLVKFLKNQGLEYSDADVLAGNLDKYREKIGLVRHRYIAHQDAETMRENIPIGQHLQSDIDEFLGNLIKFVSVVGKAIGQPETNDWLVSATACGGVLLKTLDSKGLAKT